MREKHKKKKRWIRTVLLILILFLGLSLLLYPTVANYINSLSFHKVIEDYKEKVAELDDDAYAEMLAAAHAYNSELAENTMYMSSLSKERSEVYNSLLDFLGTGVMGYIEIPKADIELPIYHGMSDAVLQSGVGHFEGSSLPVGGNTVHTLLSGHTGLPSCKLFTDIRKLNLGDTFTVHVLNEVLTYEVESIDTVLPEALEKLQIEQDKDICTLFTCTPYGVNTHRLVIRAHRIPTPEKSDSTVQDDAKEQTLLLSILIPALIVAFLVILFIILKRRRKKRRSQKGEIKE